MGWLEATHPALVPRYRTLYRPSAYAAKSYQDDVCGQVRELARAAGIGSHEPVEATRIRHTRQAADEPVAPVGDQLALL